MRGASAAVTLKRALWLAVLLASPWRTGPVQGVTGPRIGVIVSQDAEPYRQALGGFEAHLRTRGVDAALDITPLHGDPANASGAVRRARQVPVDLLFTIGSLATQTAVREVADRPIIGGLILSADDLRRAPNATGVVLEFAVETEFHWLQRALPGEKNVGVLFSPEEGKGRVEAAARAARTLGLTLHAREVTSPKELPDALEGLANRVGVVWGMADPVVLTAATARPILLFSFRNRIPFIGLSLPWVKAGALYALDRDYADIGTQCADLALKVLNGRRPDSLPPDPPRKVIYSVNLRTARQLELELPEEFLKGAARLVE